MSRYEVEVVADASISEERHDAVRQAAVAALIDQGCTPPVGCTILLTDDGRLQALNRDFLGHDKPTDVLSFPAGEPTIGADNYLGDVAISMTTAGRQASGGGHSIDDELRLLTVHAVLHLLGHDHQAQADREAMWAAQARILSGLGAEITGPATN